MSWHTNLTLNVSHNIFDYIAFILAYSTLFCKFIWLLLCFFCMIVHNSLQCPFPYVAWKFISRSNLQHVVWYFSKACILGKFYPHPSSLGKHSFIRLMRMPRAFEDRFTCDLGCGSLTQHSNDKYSFRQFLNLFTVIVLSFISIHINFLPECVCMTQSNTKQLPTCSDLHIFIPSFIPFCNDMHGKSLSLCCSATLTKQWCKSSNDTLSYFLNWGLQSNYQGNQTCVWVSQCHWHVTFLQEQILVIHTSGHQRDILKSIGKVLFA